MIIMLFAKKNCLIEAASHVSQLMQVWAEAKDRHAAATNNIKSHRIPMLAGGQRGPMTRFGQGVGSTSLQPRYFPPVPTASRAAWTPPTPYPTRHKIPVSRGTVTRLLTVFPFCLRKCRGFSNSLQSLRHDEG